MAVARRPGPMTVVDYFGKLERDSDRSVNGPTVAVNGYVYGSLNHPSSMLPPRRGGPGPGRDRPQNIKEIISTLDKEKLNQEKLRRQKEKYESFLSMPMMGRPVIDTPGIGIKETRLLQGRDIKMATGLREIYLDLGKMDFIGWMKRLGIDETNAKECYQAIHDWCVKYLRIPG